MNVKKHLFSGLICLPFVFLTGCDGVNGKPDEGSEPSKIEVSFSESEISIPVKGTSTLEVNVTPIERSDEVMIQVADDEVVSIESKTISEKSIVLELKAVSLSSTTVYAFHDELDAPVKCIVSVSPIVVENITLNLGKMALKIGESGTLSAAVLPEDATSPRISWSSDNVDVATVDGGIVTAVKEGKAMITASCQGRTAECEVEVTAVAPESLKLFVDGSETAEKTVTEKESFRIDALLQPDDVSYKTVEWRVSDPEILKCEAIVVDGNSLSAYVTALAPGSATVAAVTGELETVCTVVVNPEIIPVLPAKVGDWFYSDGTWSDHEKLDPSKTVIGIVFQTDLSRISEEEKALGFNHGLVFSLKAAFAPIDPNPDKDHRTDSLTRYALTEVECITAHRGTEACYNDIKGYQLNKTILENYPKGTSKIKNVPAFDWVHTDFSPAAPANTSGWYIPSSGQLWDLMVNLLPEEVRKRMDTVLLGGVDLYRVDQYYGLKYDFNPVESLNSLWAKVPSEYRHNLKFILDRGSQKVCQLMSSSLYSNGEDTQCIIWWMSDDGDLFPFPNYADDPILCHPVLSF